MQPTCRKAARLSPTSPTKKPPYGRSPKKIGGLPKGEPIPDALVQEGMTALVRLYAVKFQLGERWAPFPDNNTVPATAAMIMCTAMMRAVNVEVFELGMWQSWSGA